MEIQAHPVEQHLKAADEVLVFNIRRLVRECSIEINVHDLGDLEASRAFVRAGTKVFVTFLPKQIWSDSLEACRIVRRAGFDPVPHIPVRLLSDGDMLERVFDGVSASGAQEVLLVSGDYPRPIGRYSCVEDVLDSGVLKRFPLQRISFAGHPEGHPRVPSAEIRRAERAKALRAAADGLEVSFVTQFFFEADPFLDWAAGLRADGVGARLVGGIVGPTNLATLFKMALRCGAGPSIRALGARPSAFTRLLKDHGPEEVLCDLASAWSAPRSHFDGIHVFCFGGFLRTCQWLHRVAQGSFFLLARGGFEIR